MDAPADESPPDIGQLLGDDAQRAARLVAIQLQAQVRAAHARLADGGDARALHDFRVAVRRLRSWLDVEAVLPAKLVPRRARKELRKVARATNASRDRDVLAKWLAGRRGAMDSGAREAADWLLARIAGAAPDGGPGGRKDMERHYGRAMRLLDDHLPWYRPLRHVRHRHREAPFAASLAGLLRLDVARLRRRMAAVEDEADERAIHRLRVAGKRLRYHLEPLDGAVPGVDACLARLRTLQTLLGDFTDGVVWLDIVQAARAAAPDARIRHGLDRIAARIRKRGARRFRAVRTQWLIAEPPLFATVAALEDRLRMRARAER